MELTPTQTKLSRRVLLAGSAAFIATPSLAINASSAETLITKVVDQINSIINSGKSESRMFNDFENVFAKFADVPIISASVVGPPWRSASNSQKRAFQKAFTRYMAVKYGRRFREWIGGKISVDRAEPWKSHFQVHTQAVMQGHAPFTVIFRVSGKSGKDLIFDMIIEGISLLKTEAVEVRATYDANGRDLGRTTKALQNIG